MNKQVLTLLAALAIGATAAHAQEVVPFPSPVPKPTADTFYQPPAVELGELSPGTVMRYRALPTKVLPNGAKEGWQLMYRSTNTKGLPVAMVTTFFIPKTAPATGRKLLAYQSFYDSLTLNCSPSGQASSNQLLEKSFFQSALGKGIYVVVSDYEGLESQWIAARNSGQGVLDGIRAVQHFSKAGLDASTPVAMLGYSGGGFATAWAAELAPSYAPELKIVGAAQGGLPVNPINVAKKTDGTFWAGAYLGAVVGMSRAYPEINVSDYATADGLKSIADIGNRCLTGSPNLLTAYAYKKGSSLLKDPNFLDLPEIQALNDDNTMGQFLPKTPLYIFESVGDQLMPIADVDNLVKYYCDGGVKVQYKRQAGTDHVLGALGLSGGMTYLMDRCAGKAVPTTCK
jgi:hypothetical protein